MYINDEYMIYDLNKHRYILTPEALEKDYSINLAQTLDTDDSSDPERVPELFLDRCSKIIYTYIYSWASERDKTEYIIANEKYRETIKDAMEEYVYSLLLNNKEPNLLFSGKTIADLELPPSVQNILRTSGILFRGKYIILDQNWKEKRGIEY